MALATGQYRSGGQVYDADGRECVTVNNVTGGGAALQFKPISTASSGDTSLVAADATGLKCKIVSYCIVATGAVSVKFTSGLAGTALTGAMALAANGGVAFSGANTTAHVMETAANTAFVINLSGAVQVSGHISYFLEA